MARSVSSSSPAGERLQLSRAVAGGSYTSLDDYLRAHYCLLREDMVAPLRSALASLRGPQPTSADGAPREAAASAALAGATPAESN